MKGSKTVTEKQLAANRSNAHLSTGPCTIRGKSFSKLNAATSGLFAESVIIPAVDGYDGKEEFLRMYADLRREFEPEDSSEEHYVMVLARNRWRDRRAARFEKGSIAKEAKWWDGKRPQDGSELARPSEEKLAMLERAREEIASTGSLSPAVYEAILPLVKDRFPRELDQQSTVQANETDGSPEPKIDDRFSAALEWSIRLQTGLVQILRISGRRDGRGLLRRTFSSARTSHEADFPLRSRSANQSDWVLHKLLESKRRRKKADFTEA